MTGVGEGFLKGEQSAFLSQSRTISRTLQLEINQNFAWASGLNEESRVGVRVDSPIVLLLPV